MRWIRTILQFLFPQAKSPEALVIEQMAVLREQAKREGRYFTDSVPWSR